MAEITEDFEYTLGAMLNDAVSYIDEEISPSRASAMRYYRGDLFGDEQDGRSKVVSRDVHDVIQSVLPSIKRTFFGGEKMVEFMPRMPNDTPAAEQATDYVNWILEDSDWYNEFNSIAVDALLHGDGFGKAVYSEEEEVSIKQFTGLGEEELMLLASEDGELQVGQREDGTYDAILKKKEREQEFCVKAIPPEQFLIDRRATCFEDAEIVAHRCHLTVNELVEMGYDRTEMREYTGDNELTTNAEIIERQPYNTITNGESVNEDMRRVLYVEAYTKYDMDGDGIAELVKVCTAGPGYKILKIEPVDDCPFFKLSMSPNPHAFFSEGMFDRLSDIQRINSQVMRLTLDSLAQTIFPRMGVVEGDGNIEDVLNNEVGAIIRMRTPNGVIPMAQQFTGSSAFPVLDYMRQVKEQRTGISGASMGVNADMLTNATREAVNATIQAGQGQIEMICRNFASGLKRMYGILLELITTHQDKAKIIRLRDQFVPIDPTSWGEMDVVVNASISSSTVQERMAMLQYQFEKQSEAYSALGPNNGIVTLGQIRNTMAKIAELSGFKDSSQFWLPVSNDYEMEQQDPAEDPNAKATEMLAQVEAYKADTIAQTSQMKAEMDLQAKREKMESDNMQAMMKLDMERQKLELDRAKLELEYQVQVTKAEQQRAKDALEAIKAIMTQREAGDQVMQQDNQMGSAIAMLGQLIGGVAAGQQEIAAGVTAPKQVVRDESGRIVGVQTITGAE
jgi:ribosomal protein S30